MIPATHEITFGGGLLSRGFWLYIWEVTTPQHKQLYYVGRTGDSSSLKAQSPFNRMSHHLGFKKETNALRRLLEARSVRPEACSFRLVAYGPMMEEGITREEHRPRRDCVAAMEKGLAEAMTAAGYDVINIVKCRRKPDSRAFTAVRIALGKYFNGLNIERSSR